MLALLPLFTFSVLACLLFFKFRKSNQSEFFLHAFTAATVLWALCLILATELLSIFKLLTFVNVLVFWLVFLTIAGWQLCLEIKGRNRKILRNSAILNFKDPFPWYLLAMTGLIGGATFLTAWVSPPNTWDALAYHMPRVMRWIQNRGVSNYATTELLQLINPPGAEFIIAHFQLLAGSDRFANLVQWFSMLACLCAVFLFAKQLGANQKGQILAVIICATIPMGILQASSAKNDYVAGYWFVCFVYFLNLHQYNRNLQNLFFLSASLGIALFTKSSIYMFAAPFVIWFIYQEFRSVQFQKAVKTLVVFATIVSFINCFHWLRIIELFGLPFINDWKSQFPLAHSFANELFTPSAAVSNIVRNIGMHLGIPFFPNVNMLTFNAIERLHHSWMHLSSVDPRTTYPIEFRPGVGFSTAEISAGNLLHALFIFFIFPNLLLLNRKLRKLEMINFYALSIFSFYILCIMTKTNGWLVRTHLPLFILWSPLIACGLAHFNKSVVLHIAAAIFFIYSLQFVFWGANRPLVGKDSIIKKGRSEQYFANVRQAAPYFLQIKMLMNQIRPRSIGLSIESQHTEYLFWVLFQNNGNRPARIKQVSVDNVSEKFKDKNFDPDVVLHTRYNKANIGIKYHSEMSLLQQGPIFLFAKKDVIPKSDIQ